MKESSSKPILVINPGAWASRHLLVLPDGKQEMLCAPIGIPSAIRAMRADRGTIWLTGSDAIHCKSDADLERLVCGPMCAMNRDTPIVFGDETSLKLAAKDLISECLRPLIRDVVKRLGHGAFTTKVVIPDSLNQTQMLSMSNVIAIAGLPVHTIHRAADGVLKQISDHRESESFTGITVVVDIGFSGMRIVRFDKDHLTGGFTNVNYRTILLPGMEDLFEQAWAEAAETLLARYRSQSVIAAMRWQFSAMLSGFDAQGMNQSGISSRQWQIWNERAALDLSHRLRKAIQSDLLVGVSSEDVLVILSGGGVNQKSMADILCKNLPWTCVVAPDPAWASLRGHASISVIGQHAANPIAAPSPRFDASNHNNSLKNAKTSDTSDQAFMKKDPEKVADAAKEKPVTMEKRHASESAQHAPHGKDAKKQIYPSYILKGKDKSGREWSFLIEPQDWPDSNRLVVGRSGEKSDIVMAHNSISRAHAILVRKGKDFYVCDLGSTNGTVVNGRPLSEGSKPKVMLAGDTVCFGDLSLRLSIDS
jgi:hypothetical protein